MRRFEREVLEVPLIDEMLKMFHIANVGFIDEDGYPYVVPLNFGYEITDSQLLVYLHFAKKGHKVDLMKTNPHVCVEWSLFHDFPDCKYKGHYHDYRSVIAKGKIAIVNYEENPELYKRAYDKLYLCNQREIVPLSSRPKIPNMHIGVITCDLKQVTAKSEFPIRTKEDVKFMDVYQMEPDQTPFDLSDIIEKRKPNHK